MHALHTIWQLVAPPTTVPSAEHAQEPISHEPWVTILLAVIAMVGSTIAAWFGYLGHARAKEAKEQAVENHTVFKETIGEVNGEGNLMNQLTKVMDHQTQDSMALTDHITHADTKLEHIHSRVSHLDKKLNDHLSESTSYHQKIDEVIKLLMKTEGNDQQ